VYNHAPEHYLCPFCRLIRDIEHEPPSAMHTDTVLLVQNSSPLGNARVSLGHGEISPRAKRMHGSYATKRKDGSETSPCTSSILTCLLISSGSMPQP
jgi:hypothetical protein